GQIIVYIIWISVILIIFSLFFGYIALKRRIVLYSFFSEILDFFYMPLRTIYVSFGKRKKLDSMMVELKNKANKKKFEKTEKRILIAPHCLRSLQCPAYGTREGIQCKSCGKCPYTEIKKVADKLGMKVYILTGSSAVRYIVKTKKFESVILLACYYDLNKVMRYLDPHNIIFYGVPLTKDGCFNTKTNLKKLYSVMGMGLDK
ncbi:MAG: DUF116 domain-containing protein, partial [Candidatus Aenigmarchaeota archaeon]|nr:DUF116 domain-containing protein [Candidatus Aenigmarchaeota archaeon]